MEEKTEKRLNLLIPVELHRNLKILAAEKSMTIGQLVALAIAEMIERSKKNDNEQ